MNENREGPRPCQENAAQKTEQGHHTATPADCKADPSIILSTIRAIRVDEAQVIELRAMEVPLGRGRPATVAGFFDDDDALVSAAMELDRQRAPAIYITLNEPDPAILARAQNRVIPYAKHLTADSNIVRRVWLPIDIDPVRLAGISATAAEVKQADALRVEVAAKIQEWFGVAPTIIGFSGNGHHLLYRIDAPNTDDVHEAIKAILNSLSVQFSNQAVKVDITSGNASRIWKLYGTVAGKGDSTPDRPHRLARILYHDEAAGIIPTDALLGFAGQHAPPQVNDADPLNGTARGISESVEELTKYLTDHGVKVKSIHDGDERKKILILDGCPMNGEHGQGTDTAVVLRPDGMIGFECKHDSCQKYTWPEVRAKIDPEWATEKKDAKDKKKKGKPNASGVILELLDESGAKLFHDPEGSPFATVVVGDHIEVWPVRKKEFRSWLSRLYWQKTKRAIASQSLADALNVVEAVARHDGPEAPIFIRVAGDDTRIVVDLADTQWRVVEITAAGWRIIDRSPFYFRRPRGMLPLPTPERGGSLSEFRELVNLPDDGAWSLTVGAIVTMFRTAKPFPVLSANGEQGSAKTTYCMMIREIVDPNTCPLRAAPRDARDLAIAANNGLIVGFDNISKLPDWLSDGLCRLATGGGFSTRELYTDDDEKLFTAKRPVILNGIEDFIGRSDLLDRAVILTLPTIPDNKRRPEAELWRDFHAIKGRIFGAVLDAVSSAIRNLPSVALPTPPRMADFATWSVAAEMGGGGLRPGQFLAAYASNRAASVELSLEDSPIYDPLVKVLKRGAGWWAGTATELLKAIEGVTDEKTQKLEGWPKAANALAGKLRRIMPDLRRIGIEARLTRDGRTRWIEIEKTGEKIVTSAPSSPNPTEGRKEADCGGDPDAISDDPGAIIDEGSSQALNPSTSTTTNNSTVPRAAVGIDETKSRDQLGEV